MSESRNVSLCWNYVVSLCHVKCKNSSRVHPYDSYSSHHEMWWHKPTDGTYDYMCEDSDHTLKSVCLRLCYDTEEIGLCGDPICVSTLSSHCRGPCRCTSIQQGVLVTSWRWYSAPQPWGMEVAINLSWLDGGVSANGRECHPTLYVAGSDMSGSGYKV